MHESLNEILNSSILERISEKWKMENWLKNNSSRSKNKMTDKSEDKDNSQKSKEVRKRIKEINGSLDAHKISSELGGVACISLITYFNSDTGKWSLDRLNKLNINPTSTNYSPIPSH